MPAWDFSGDFLPGNPELFRFLFGFRAIAAVARNEKAPHLQGFFWSEREDLNLRPLVSQTSALTGLRHAPMPFP